jgi:O-antigen ligase
LFFIEPVSSTVGIYFRLERLSTGRDFILNSVSEVIKENYLLGAGPAGTRLEIYKHLPYMLGGIEEQFIRKFYTKIEFGHAHNFYLFFLSDMGIIGLLLSLALPVLFFYFGLKILKAENSERGNKALVIGILGAGLTIFIRGIFEWSYILSYGTIKIDLPLWLMFVILIHIYIKIPGIKDSISPGLK